MMFRNLRPVLQVLGLVDGNAQMICRIENNHSIQPNHNQNPVQDQHPYDTHSLFSPRYDPYKTRNQNQRNNGSKNKAETDGDGRGYQELCLL